MKVEDHLASYREHRDTIFKWAVDILGLEHAQRIVGLHASRAIVELLSAMLHKRKLVDEGFQLNHRWFKSEKVAQRLPDFENKGTIVKDIVALERISETLAYGGPKPVARTKDAIELFAKIEKELAE